MFKLILSAFTVVLFATPFNAKAQSAEPVELCGAPSPAILGLIEGSWQLRQGAGVAVAGPSMVIPLPAHPAQPMDLSIDGAMHAVWMAGGSPRQEMLMMPTRNDVAMQVMSIINEEQAAGFTGNDGECGEGTLPLIVGFNTYSLIGQPTGAQDGFRVVGLIGGKIFDLCVPGLQTGEGSPETEGNGSIEYYAAVAESYTGVTASVAGGRYACAEQAVDPPDATPGTMVMSVALKFHTTSRASGWVQFEGEQDGMHFVAKAPVEMTR